MLSETVNTKVINNNAAKNCHVKTSADAKKDVNVSKKESTIGLRVPGSNWQRFKNLIAESTTNDQPANKSEIKKKKIYRKPVQKLVSVNGVVNQVKYFIFYVLQLLYYYLTNFFSEQQVAVPSIKKTMKSVEPQNLLTKAVAMDCEMVGIGDGSESMIARVSIVNHHGTCIYDKYVKPTEEVVDFRTAVSGIRPHHLKNGEDFQKVQKEVAEILKGRILVGHALHNDLSVLFLAHPKRSQRDTSRYKLFRKITKGGTPSLKKLAAELLGIDIQSGEHNSIEDARATMQIYQLFRKKWEAELRGSKM